METAMSLHLSDLQVAGVRMRTERSYLGAPEALRELPAGVLFLSVSCEGNLAVIWQASLN